VTAPAGTGITYSIDGSQLILTLLEYLLMWLLLIQLRLKMLGCISTPTSVIVSPALVITTTWKGVFWLV
jgi:hypothetical protein